MMLSEHAQRLSKWSDDLAELAAEWEYDEDLPRNQILDQVYAFAARMQRQAQSMDHDYRMSKLDSKGINYARHQI